MPYRAQSAATLLSLGADNIIMGEMGQPSPIDPTTTGLFNPVDPINPAGRWPISVEDVTAYLSLAKEKAGLVTEESIRDVFRIISDKVNPIALGNVHRIYNLIRLLAPKLLGLHMDSSNVSEQAKIKQIIDTLTEKLYTHDYIISSQEAKQIGLKIKDVSQKIENTMWDLYKKYETDLKLLEPFSPDVLLGNQNSLCFKEECAYLETEIKSFSFVAEGEIFKPPSLDETLALFPPQINQQIFQILPQLVQLRQQMHFLEPTLKIKSQKWLCIQ
jgi:hypothetical protein